MSSPAQALANAINAQSSTGPRTEDGKSTSSQNAITHGLFTDHDFIRPGEQAFYADLDEQLNRDLAPIGMLEYELVNEIRRAMWRLRRCGLVEESMVSADPAPGIGSGGNHEAGHIPDPMQLESQAKLQLSVDRARSQAHRLLHKCTAELRKLQTERVYRNESLPAGTDISSFGIADWPSIQSRLIRESINTYRRDQLRARVELDAILDAPLPAPSQSGSFCKTDSGAVQTPRNAPCPCGSGQKHKRCCGKNAMPTLQAA